MKVTNSFCRLDHKLHGVYENIQALNYFNLFRFFKNKSLFYLDFLVCINSVRALKAPPRINGNSAIHLVLALLSRNHHLTKPIKQLFSLFLSLFFTLSFVLQKLSRTFQNLEFEICFLVGNEFLNEV